MNPLYPLTFRPTFQERVWGGRRLARYYDGLPDGPVGEAWVLSAHPAGAATVAHGPLTGKSLAELTATYGARLTGTAAAGAFPLLIKLLDTREDLSVQVHPTNGYPRLAPGELGKTEMWVILDAAPDASLIYGVLPGVTPAALAAAAERGDIMTLLKRVPARPGQVFYVPAGTVHALGAGLLVAEIQQSSDTTYRLYDYDRPGLDGKPRPLHLQDGLAVANCAPPPAPGQLDPGPSGQWRELVRSPYFAVAHGRCDGVWTQRTSPDSCDALLVLEGSGSLTWAGGGGGAALAPGASVLVPAELGEYQLTGSFEALLTRLV